RSGCALGGRLVSPAFPDSFGSDRLNGGSKTTRWNRTMRDIFRNRIEAGKLLAEKLMCYANQPNVIVLGLPRGGVPVAFEVAKALRVPLDVFVVRKLGTPWQRELAMGAIATGGVRVLNEEVVQGLGIPMEVIDAVTAEEKQELKRRELAYRGSCSEPELRGKTVILIDDGVATGSTMRAAVRALNAQHPARLVVSVPTVAGSTYVELRQEVDNLVALMTPERFYGVGQWYEDFNQTSDAEVTDLLERAKSWRPAPKVAGAANLNFSQVFKLVRTKYVHNLHRRRYVMTSFTLDPLHSEISWVRGLFSELPRFFGDRSDLFAPQRQSSCTLTRSREPTL